MIMNTYATMLDKMTGESVVGKQTTGMETVFFKGLSEKARKLLYTTLLVEKTS